MTADRAAIADALPAYEIGEELGRGAWGIVVEGRHRQLRREVAIKQLPPAFAYDVDVRSRFVTEARLLGALDHPHIVPVYDFVERDGLCLLVMEKLSGGTAWARFTDEGLAPETACAIALVTAMALDYAHGQGVLHRDVKPENLLFSRDGSLLKVADFGIAKVLTGERTLATSSGEVLGTPAYMAPEQCVGGEITPATDVYSVGVSLFEMLSGRLPFEEADSTLATLYRRVHEPPAELGDVAPDVPEALAAVVMRAITTAPEDRYRSAERFAHELATAATAAFGRGWLDRAGVRAILGGRIAAMTEREPPNRTAEASSGPVRPRETLRAPSAPVEARPDDLVPVAELRPAGESASLGELRRLLARSGNTDARRLAMEIERVESSAHDLKELELLRRVRSGAVPLAPDEREQVERLLGASGPSPVERLGLPATADVERLRHAAEEQATQWRARAENPFSPRSVVDAARILSRTCEGIVAELPAPPDPST